MWEYGNMRMRKWGNGKMRKRSILAFSQFLILALSYSHSLTLHSAPVQQGYTNHAGNVIAGWPVALTPTQVTLGNGGFIETALPSASGVGSNALGRAGSMIPPRGETYPLSIFPESEQRRIAADFGAPRVPLAVKRAIAGAEKAMARSRKRAEKGLCTKKESETFCAKSSAALKAYLDKQVESGVITPAERKALGR